MVQRLCEQHRNVELQLGRIQQSGALSGKQQLGLTATEVDRPEQLMLGDVILYDWDGDGRFQHSTVVTAFDAGGMPLVNAHTVSSRHRYWDYRDSYAWTERTVYRLFILQMSSNEARYRGIW